jgi:hypothetical protein
LSGFHRFDVMGISWMSVTEKPKVAINAMQV